MFHETSDPAAGPLFSVEPQESEITPLAVWASACAGCGRVHLLEGWLELPFLRLEPGFAVEADQEVRSCQCGRELRSPITALRLRGDPIRE